MPVYDRLCRPSPSDLTVEELVTAECKATRFRNQSRIHTVCRILDGMDFPERVPDETYGMLAAGAEPGSLLAMVIDSAMQSRDLYLVNPGPRRLFDLLPNATAIAMHQVDTFAFASVSDGVMIWVGGKGFVRVPQSIGLRAVEMHFVDSTTLVAVLVGESNSLTLPVRVVATVYLKASTLTVHVTHVNLTSRRSAMACGFGLMAIGGVDGDIHLFDLVNGRRARRVQGPGAGSVSAVSFDQEARVLYVAQGSALSSYNLDNSRTKHLLAADGTVRFLHGTDRSVVALVAPTAVGPAVVARPLLVPLRGQMRTIHMQIRDNPAHVIGITGRGTNVAITQIDEDAQSFQLLLFNVPAPLKRKRDDPRMHCILVR